MRAKMLLGVSVSMLELMTSAPLVAQAADAPVRKSKPGQAQESPKPDAASDQNANTVNPGPQEQLTPADDAGTGDIVVTGIRRSIESAQAIKRNSDGIVDAIVAEDIGKLPDTFASSALQRVTGVQVTRAAGEAADVQVRGLPDLSTTYNGRELFTAENRSVAIQDFPAGTVAALEVYKSGTANLVEGGIGGQVNVRGRRPFDFNGFELSGSVNEIQFEQAQKFSPNGNLLISNRWDTGIGEIGILLNGSYVGLDFLDSTREQSVVIATANADQTASPGFRYPDAQALYYGGGHRWRPSANGAIQWKPTPELEIYLDGLFQGFRSRDSNRYMFVPIFGGLQLSNVTLRPDNPALAQSLTVTNAVRPDGFYASVNAKTDTYQGGGGAIWKRDRLQISGDVAYTKSTFTLTSANIDFAFASSPVRNVNFDTPGDDGGPTFSFGGFDITDPANFISRGLFQENLVGRGSDIQARGDVQYDFGDESFLRRIQFGVRYNDRDAGRRRGSSYVNNEGARIPLSSLPVDLGTTNPGFTYNDAFPVRRFVNIPSSSIRANLPALRQSFGQPADFPGYSPLETFSGNEKAYTAYGQLKYGFDLGDVVLDGLIGLRAVKTKTRVNGTSRIINVVANPNGTTSNVESFVPGASSNDYTDYLPNASLRVGLQERLQLRLAYTQTRTRPTFGQLNPSTTINSPTTTSGDANTNPNSGSFRSGNGGNPDLTPLSSNNYDASLEYYFSRSGSLTGAIFRRDVTGFIQDFEVRTNDPVFGDLRVTRPFNLGKTRFQGAELAFTSFLDFTFLPDWAKGFGIQANGTYVDAKGDQPAQVGRVRFPGVSKWAGNLIVLYERPQFSARAAYNYRSAYVRSYSQEAFDPVIRPTVERKRGQLDLSATMTPVSNITIAFDVTNVLGNPLRRYRDFTDNGDSYPRQILYLERAYSLGVRFRF